MPHPSLIDPPEPKYLSSYAVARLIQVSPSAVLNWIKKGLLPAHRTPGGHRRIERSVLVSFLREHNMPIPREIAAASRLLIIDDDVAFCRTMKRLLARRAPLVTVDVAHNGVDGLINVGVLKPDNIMLDAFMPDMDGLAVCKQLRNNEDTKGVGIIAVSGKPSPKLQKEFLAAGAIGWMAKPVDVDELLGLLENTQSSQKSA